MFCGSCLSGNTLVGALGRTGDDVTLLPLYTPLRTDEENHAVDHIGMGGINVYIRQRWPRLRLPAVVQRWLDRPSLLRWAARRGSSTRPEELGALCVSMLRGDDGRQRTEVDKLVEWIAEHLRPELVHLNNALLIGLARRLNQRLGVPVVCSLTGEDTFLEKLPEPFRSEAKRVLHERIGDCAALAAMNAYYADFMADYLDIARSQIAVIPPGIELGDFAEPVARAKASSELSIGFLSRVCADKGLHHLIEAAGRLAREASISCRVQAAGYLDPVDAEYLATCRRQAKAAGLGDRFDYAGSPDRTGKVSMLGSLDVFCLPTETRESKALPVYEAWAAGVPVVLPAHGAFVELVEQSGGGLLYPPGDMAALVDALWRLADSPDERIAMGSRGRAYVFAHHSAEQMATRTRAWYRRVLGSATDAA